MFVDINIMEMLGIDVFAVNMLNGKMFAVDVLL